MFLQKVTLQICLKKYLQKVQCLGHTLLVILTEKKLLKHSMKKNCKK